MTLNELKEGLSLDINNLHVAAQNQSVLLQEVGELFADAKAEHRRKKLALDSLRAKVEIDVRTSPESYGLPKVTEGSIHSAVVMHQDVVDAQEECVQHEQYANLLSSVYDAYQHKKSMIQVETKLFLAGYWSDPEGDVERRILDNNKNRRRRQIKEEEEDE